MKRLLAALLILAFALPAMAYDESRNVYRSSYTTSAETTKHIDGTGPSTELVRVVVSSASASGALTLYDSSGTATTTIGVVNLGATGEYNYNVNLSSGLTYTSAGNEKGVTIIYRNW